LTPLGAVRVTDLTVQDAHGVGILLAGTNGARVDHVDARDDGAEGIQALGTTATLIDHDFASGASVAGIAIAGQPDPLTGPPVAPSADAVVYGNDVTANQRGHLHPRRVKRNDRRQLRPRELRGHPDSPVERGHRVLERQRKPRHRQ
jgi:hypothetical protein